jgi:hypothetical protein
MQKGVEKLNPIQNVGEYYFKNKINELMGQKKVIQCLHDEKVTKKDPHGNENVERGNMVK